LYTPKKMPAQDMCEAIVKGMKLFESFAFPVIRESLGEAKVEELKNKWQKQSAPVPEDAPYEEKYEIMFRNWLLNWQSAYDVIHDGIGEDGVQKLILGGVDGWKKSSAGAAITLLNFIRSVSPKTAFGMFEKQFAYSFQVFTPYTVPEFTQDRMVLDIAHCKFLDVEGCYDPCRVACQKIVPLWMEEQFKVKTTMGPSDKSLTMPSKEKLIVEPAVKSCKCTFTRL
jgi:hypothetical protein